MGMGHKIHMDLLAVSLQEAVQLTHFVDGLFLKLMILWQMGGTDPTSPLA